MTYNVHGCVGVDRQLSPERIAAVIVEQAPDVVCLQEVDVGRARSGGVDQARHIAERAGMHSLFHPAMRHEEEQYGEAILARRPLSLVHAGALPAVKRQILKERRGALWVEVEAEDGPLQVLCTHFGLGRIERRAQAKALLGAEWMEGALARGRAVVCGDFNSMPGRRVHSLLAARMRDAYRTVHGRSRRTFSTKFPVFCLDYIFVSAQAQVKRAEVVKTELSRVASDHYPVLVELGWGA